jgi:lysophospholipase L1-like esterase
MNAVAGGSANTAGVFVKMMDGTFYRALFTVASASIVVSHVSATGTILSSSSLTLPNGGAYGWVANHELSIGFGMGSGSQIYLTSNGLPIYQFPAGLTAACGWYLANGSNCDQVTFKNPLKWTGWQPRVKRPLKIALIGDSTTYCAWASIALEDTLVMALQNSPEIGNVEVTNLGVSGTNSAYWVTQTATMDFSSYDLVLVMVGTNDQQGNISLATYEANLTSIRANIAATNTNMVWGVFPVYTSAVQSGITGVTTSNYAYSAGYVHTLWKWIATNGYSYADVRAHFGSNLAWYSDNIHPSVEGLIAYTAAWTEGVRRFMVKRGGYLA